MGDDVIRLVCVVFVIVALAGCGGGLASAKSDFKSGRLAEAKERLVALEPESRTYPFAKRAEYTLYRGLVHHSLGDLAAAAVWLDEAKAIEQAHPRTLSDDDRARLDLALEAVTR